jgi:hypothetical protein
MSAFAISINRKEGELEVEELRSATILSSPLSVHFPLLLDIRPDDSDSNVRRKI